MPTLQEILQPHATERRAIGRTLINRGVLMHFVGLDGVYGCCVRDVTNLGAGIRLNGLNIIPSEFSHFVRQLPHDASLPPDLARR
jgi:hypothetical protein